jgi:hypothetical protein
MASPYGTAHQRTRARLLPAAYGTPCPLCGLLMLRGQRLHLDHSTPVVMGGTHGDRITHGWCNEGAGGRLARQRARGSSSGSNVGSQDW